MVFWSNLKKKITSLVSRQEFNTLKNKVDNDVVLKNMTGNTTINNSGNTIVSAPITNITSRTGDIELRVNNSSKSINCGGSKITGLGAPTANDNATNKEYVDTQVNAKANAADVVLKNMTENTTIDNTGNTLILANIAHIQSTGSNQNVEIRTNGTGGLELGNKKIKNMANPTEAQDATNKRYVDNINTTLTNAVNTKANANDVYLKSQTYTRSEIDNKDSTINNRFANYYTKSESDSRFVGGANYYTKSEINGFLSNKANSTDVYTKSEANSKFVDLNADQTIHGYKKFYRTLNMTGERIESLGTPTNSTDASTKGYVDNQINALPTVRITRIRFDDVNVSLSDIPNKGAMLTYNISNAGITPSRVIGLYIVDEASEYLRGLSGVERLVFISGNEVRYIADDPLVRNNRHLKYFVVSYLS